ncbi:KH domain-containing protein HEN4 [Nicotiana tabacum]|uniref:KH domain-containing protein At4g18375 n=1 Tax=Nicotiana tabacum TaxID=4097 RepID=A0A1S4DBR9_TOBAC|nr:KH domain-containing protein HEN4-like [Nicotiana tomentosiformis]XP_016510659.1 PREDICTED: KH domain-containing protein At4g18375-like [Nicotiana tabacum]
MHEPNLVAASSVPHSATTVPAAANNNSPLPRRVVFRLLCHASRVGGVIGKSGSIIRQLQQDTSAKIHVDVSTPNSDHHRLIVVVASASLNKKIRLNLLGPTGGDEQQWNDEIEVSAAQEALVRVFERVIDVTAENNGVVLGAESVVSCRLLVKGNQVGALMGKGGKVIDAIRRENGCRIKVLTSDKLPSCASPNDEIVEIEGDILAVKKALVAVSRRLQDCFSVERNRTVENAPLELDSEQTLPPRQVDLPAQRSSMSQPITTSSFSGASGCHPVSLDAEKFSNIDAKIPLQEVAFRILCPNEKVGAIIGKGGAIVRTLQNDSGASIAVGPNVVECNERVIAITALENLELRKSPAQTAAVLVFDRILDAGSGMNLGTRSLITFRLVVPSNQVGCLLGKGGAIISEIRKETGSSIRIFRGDQVPKCVSDNDEVVQIAGEFVNVQDALRNVTGRLRDNLLAAKVSNGAVSRNSSPLASESSFSGQMKEPPFGFHRSSGVSHGINQHPDLTRSMDNLVLSNNIDHPPSPGQWSSQTRPGGNQRGAFDVSKGSNSVKGGIELGCGSRSAIVTNTTVEILVPESVISSVYGENGSNLARLRQISGAKVMVHEGRSGTTDRTIVISGTPDETQAAQSLLQAFILTG